MTRMLAISAVALLSLGGLLVNRVEARPTCSECYPIYQACLNYGTISASECYQEYLQCQEGSCGFSPALRSRLKSEKPADAKAQMVASRLTRTHSAE